MISKSIQVVVLAFNEEETIQECLEKTYSVLKKNCQNFEVLIYDDGSTDNTSQICNSFATQNSYVRIIHHEKNMGIGYLLKISYMKASFFWTVIICSDMQFDPQDLEMFFPFLNEYDVIISGRKKRKDTFFRKCITTIDKLLLKILFSVSFKDLHWIKFVKTDFIEKESLTADSPFIETELLIRAKNRGARFKEFLVPHYPRLHGVASGAGLFNIFSSVRDMLFLFVKQFGK